MFRSGLTLDTRALNSRGPRLELRASASVAVQVPAQRTIVRFNARYIKRLTTMLTIAGMRLSAVGRAVFKLSLSNQLKEAGVSPDLLEIGIDSSPDRVYRPQRRERLLQIFQRLIWPFFQRVHACDIVFRERIIGSL